MKQDDFDKLFRNSKVIGAPEGFTEEVMRRIASLPDCKQGAPFFPLMPRQLKKLGVSMIATAAVLFITVFIPGNQLDILNQTVQAQTKLINEKTNKAYEWAYNPVREFNTLIEDVGRKLSKLREVR